MGEDSILGNMFGGLYNLFGLGRRANNSLLYNRALNTTRNMNPDARIELFNRLENPSEKNKFINTLGSNGNGSYFWDANGNFNWGNAADFGLDIANILGGLYNGIMGAKAMNLAKKQAAFQEQLARDNFYKQTTAYNDLLTNKYTLSAGLGNGTMDANGLASQAPQSAVDAARERAKEQYLPTEIGQRRTGLA